MDLMKLTACKLGKKIKLKEINIEDVILATYENIELKESNINSLITIYDKSEVLNKAREVQALIDSGKLNSPIAGVPVVIKDNICTKDKLTTCGSKILSDFVPTYSATAVEKLEKAGAIIIGKANMDEFAMGSTCETSFYGVTKNPHNTDYVPGGSSGGSCAAVSADMCSFSLGTDTGGSIRRPSAYCGVVGIKPTYGTVSRFGLVAYGSSLDQIGPVTKDVRDCATVLEIISGDDEKDSTSIKRDEYDFTSALLEDIKEVKIGIPKDFFEEGLDLEVKETVLNAINVLKNKGAIVEEFNIGLTDYFIPTYYTIASAEASSNLSRFDGVKYGYRIDEYADLSEMYKKTRTEGFGGEVKKRIMLGTFALSSGFYDEYYVKALKARRLIKERFNKAFEKYDVIISPVTPSAATKIGEENQKELSKYLSDIYTVAANLTGIPAISIPCGVNKKGLPIGMQIMADCFKEKKIINVAYAYEQATKQN